MNNVQKFTNKIGLDEDIESLPQIEIEEVDVKFNDNILDDISDDYKYSRNKLMYAMAASEAVMKHALRDMSDDPGPRKVEAFSTVLKTMNETCDRIFSLHEKMKKVNPKPIEIQPGGDGDGESKTVRATVNEIIDGMDEK